MYRLSGLSKKDQDYDQMVDYFLVADSRQEILQKHVRPSFKSWNHWYLYFGAGLGCFNKPRLLPANEPHYLVQVMTRCRLRDSESTSG